MDEEKTTGLKGKGSRVLGVLGALLGAFLGTFCWHLLMFFSLGREFAWGSLTILGGIVVSWTACWGYRLLRGYRAMGFAKWTVRICMLLAQPASMAVVFTMMSLRQRYGSLRVHADTLAVVFGQSVQNLLQTDILLLLGQLSLIVLVFSRLGWVTLLKYVDPQWAADPRRIAQTNGGGAGRTHCCWGSICFSGGSPLWIPPERPSASAAEPSGPMCPGSLRCGRPSSAWLWGGSARFSLPEWRCFASSAWIFRRVCCAPFPFWCSCWGFCGCF